MIEYKLLESGCLVADGKFDAALALLQSIDQPSKSLVNEISAAIGRLSPTKSSNDVYGTNASTPSYAKDKKDGNSPISYSTAISRSISMNENTLTSAIQESISNDLKKLTHAYENEKLISKKEIINYTKTNNDNLNDSMVFYIL